MKSNASAGFLSKPKNDGKTGVISAKTIEEVVMQHQEAPGYKNNDPQKS